MTTTTTHTEPAASPMPRHRAAAPTRWIGPRVPARHRADVKADRAHAAALVADVGTAPQPAGMVTAGTVLVTA